ADDVGVALAVDGDATPPVAGAAAEVGAVERRRARGIQRRHEGVALAPVGRLEGIGRREVRRAGPAGDVGVALAVDGDATPRVAAVAAEAGAVAQGGPAAVGLADGRGGVAPAEVGL